VPGRLCRRRRVLLLTRYIAGPPSAVDPPAGDPPVAHSTVTVPSPGNDTTTTDRSRQKSSPVNIPSRSSSNQKSAESNSRVIPPATALTGLIEPPPSPRRGSKRSLLSRSRNNSRSSRRSARAARAAEAAKEPVPPLPPNDGPRSEKKVRNGFLAFLNCCSGRQEDIDSLSHDEPDVAAKKIKIQPTPPRSTRPPEQNEVVENEKMTDVKPLVVEDRTQYLANGEGDKAEMGEKRPIDEPRHRVTKESDTHDKVPPVPPAVDAPVPAPREEPDDGGPEEVALDGEHDLPRVRPITTHDPATKPGVNVITATPIEGDDHVAESQRQISADSKRNSDVEMTDAPPMAPEDEEDPLDEPLQPAELLPQVPLPPPPPLSKRQELLGTREVPPVPEVGPERQTYLLPPVEPHLKGRKCLVLDLDETLVHSSFKLLNQADFTIPVEIEGQYHNVYVIKRPGVDQFMKRVGELYEIVVFTASVSKYGDPLLDQLDIHHVVHHRLFRESCYNHQGNYVKVHPPPTGSNRT